MVKPLFVELVDLPRRVLVICGGPSTATNLKHVPADWPEVVISANAHGFKQDKFKVDYVVSCDWYFNGGPLPMQQHLAKFGAVNINRWSWADYRLPQWTFNGDSGLTAIYVARLLGGHPIIVLGCDRWTGSKRYFWQTDEEGGYAPARVCPNVDNIRVSTEQCVEWCRGGQIRMFGGPMRAYWPEYDETEIYPTFAPVLNVQTMDHGRPYMVTEPIFLHPADRVATGPIMLTANEARPHLLQRKIHPL